MYLNSLCCQGAGRVRGERRDEHVPRMLRGVRLRPRLKPDSEQRQRQRLRSSYHHRPGGLRAALRNNTAGVLPELLYSDLPAPQTR